MQNNNQHSPDIIIELFNNKEHLPEMFVLYIESSDNKYEKKKRTKFIQSLIGDKVYLYHLEPNETTGIARCLSDWIITRWIDDQSSMLNIKKHINIINDIIVCTNIINGNQNVEDEFMQSLCWFFTEYPVMIDDFLYVFPEYKDTCDKIINEKNTFWFKLKYRSKFTPAFNGSGCVLL